jgi:hypothetical protein
MFSFSPTDDSAANKKKQQFKVIFRKMQLDAMLPSVTDWKLLRFFRKTCEPDVMRSFDGLRKSEGKLKQVLNYKNEYFSIL